MNRNDFLNMIENRAPVTRQMIGEVYELIDIFPYFQSAHMLLLKGLQINNDVKFENQLRLSAMHIADREALYYLLKTEPSQEVTTGEVKPDKTLPDSNVFGPQQTVIESAKNSEYLISEIEKNSDEDRSEELKKSDSQAPVHSILISTESDNDESSGVMLLIDEEASSSEDKIFYMDPGFSVPDHSDLLELDIDFSLEHSDGEEMNSRKRSQSDLIDKFIITNPRIEPIKEKSDLTVEEISKPIIEEEGGFVTETLARIYVNQGYYSKAMDIYEKLSLKFPEKSSYFASQIDKVKEFIKK